MSSRRFAHALALAALLIGLVPCPPMRAQDGCGMSGACPMRPAGRICRTAHSTGFDCCKTHGERTPSPVSPSLGAQTLVATIVVASDAVPFAASVSGPALETPPRAYGSVHRFTLHAVFLI